MCAIKIVSVSSGAIWLPPDLPKTKMFLVSLKFVGIFEFFCKTNDPAEKALNFSWGNWLASAIKKILLKTNILAPARRMTKLISHK